jgi:hypothetical protein
MKRHALHGCEGIKSLRGLLFGIHFCPHDVSAAAMLDTHIVVLGHAD